MSNRDCKIDVSRVETINYSLTCLACVLYLMMIKIDMDSPRKKMFIYMSIIMSMIIRIFQYWFVFHNIRNNKCMLDFTTLFTCYIIHITLFSSLYYLNYKLYGLQSFTFIGGPLPGEPVKYNNSSKDFVDNINVNILYYTTTTSFAVGYGDITSRSTFSKLTTIVHMIDAAFLLIFLFGKMVESLKITRVK